MKYPSILLTSLFLISANSHTMEINFDSLICDFDTFDTPESPSFLDLEDSNRSFANHELLWARKMNDKKLLNPDIIDVILEIRYCQIGSDPIFQPSMMDLKCKYFNAVFWLNKGQQTAFYYLRSMAPKDNENHFVITRANKEFSKKMIKHIDNFPILLKQVLKKDSNNTFYIQTSEPILNNLLGKGESRVKNINNLGTVAGFLTSGMLFSFSLYVCSKLDNEHFRQGLYRGVLTTIYMVAVTSPMGDREILETASGGANMAIILALFVMGAMICERLIGIEINDGHEILLLGALVAEVLAAIPLNAGAYMKSYVRKSLTPTNLDDQMTLRGFEKRFFFPEQRDEI